MTVFWLEWELWMKLVFLLACCIVITVAAALLKVAFLRHRYSKLAAEDKEAVSHEHVEVGYLFGAPALERGNVVEGIWTPHSNTPESSRETLRRSSSELVLVDSRHTVSKLRDPHRTEMSRQTSYQRSSRPVSIDHSEANISLDCNVADTEESELHLNGSALSTTSYSLFMLQHPDFAQAMDDIEKEYQAAAPAKHETTPRFTRRPENTANETRYKSSSNRLCVRRASDTVVRSSATTIDTLPLSSRHSSDLSMLDRQRHKLAAETGQFVQRRHRK